MRPYQGGTGLVSKVYLTILSMKRPIPLFISLVRFLLKQFSDDAETVWSSRLFHKFITLSEKNVALGPNDIFALWTSSGTLRVDVQLSKHS